jgi:pyruvate/2-oxoglutarate/acetoin dehydrogenase E1 component
MPQGAGHQLGPTHSHSFEAMFLQVPGLLVAVPSTAADARGLLKTAIRDENPVIFIEHESLYGVRGEVDEQDEQPLAFGRARIVRAGGDVTIVGVSRMALTAERAANLLSTEHGIEAEVIDPRTLRPLDLDTILESVARTNRCVIVEEGWPHGGVGANLAALISEQAFDDLDAPVMRVSGADVPMPYSKPLEQSAFPHEPQIVRAALSVLGHDPTRAIGHDPEQTSGHGPSQVPASLPAAGDGQREAEANAPGAVQEAMQETGLENEIRQASR